MRGTQLVRNEGVRVSRREDVMDHVVVGTPDGPEFWELVEVYEDKVLAGWAIKRYGGLVPWSLFEGRSFRERRIVLLCWMEATGGREAP